MGEASRRLFARAKEVIPGGVNSPARAFGSVGGEPFFVDRADGARLTDVDGNTYIDYVMSWGALMLGHAHPAVTRAITEATARGTSYGAPSGAEVELAQLVVAQAAERVEPPKPLDQGEQVGRIRGHHRRLEAWSTRNPGAIDVP